MTTVGVAISVGASALFGVLFYYTTLLRPLTGEEIVGWRVLVTIPVLTLMLCGAKQWGIVTAVFRRIRRAPQLVLGLIVSSAILSAQLWLFAWAPMNGRALDVSLGFFLFPLVMVLTGRIVFREKLTVLQIVATGLAAVGVAHELWRVGGISWVVLLVAGGYPIYFVVRKSLGLDNLGGLWCELVLMVPMMVTLLFLGPSGLDVFIASPIMILLVIGLGVIGSVALVGYILASKYLNLSLFGLLSYLEPALLLVVAVLLGESIAPDEWWTYLPVWAAILVLAADGIRSIVVGGLAAGRAPAAPEGAQLDEVPFR